MQKRVFSSHGYDEALSIIMNYVNITSADDMEGTEDEDMNMGVS